MNITRTAIVAHATAWPRTYTFTLYQTGPKTFVWMNGSNRVSETPNFRDTDAAIAYAIDNGWTLAS